MRRSPGLVLLYALILFAVCPYVVPYHALTGQLALRGRRLAGVVGLVGVSAGCQILIVLALVRPGATAVTSAATVCAALYISLGGIALVATHERP